MTRVGELLQQAVGHHQAGNLQQAEQLYRQVLQEDSHQLDALHLLGFLLHQVGHNDLAAKHLRRALQLKPDFGEAHNTLGVVLKADGKLVEAVASLREAVRLRPADPGAHNNLAVALVEQRQLAEAVTSLHRALDLAPDFALAHNNLGNALKNQGRLAEATASFQQALRLRPDDAEAHNNLGIVLRKQGHLAEAVASFREALHIRPDHAEALNNLGNALAEQGQSTEAVASFQQALRVKPAFAEAHNNLGNALKDQGRLPDALASFQEAVRLRPDYADAHVNLAMTCLLLGDFAQGWQEYEWRVKERKARAPLTGQPLWDGSPLAGKTILLHDEQGLGDTLQFIRYAALVKERGGAVQVACALSLVPLLKTCSGVNGISAKGSPLPPFDVQAPLLSLPGIFGTSLGKVPARVPYLFADARLIERWRQELNGFRGFRIGIAWQGNPKYPSDRFRSIALAHFAPLACLEGVRLINLQKGPGTEQLRAAADRVPVTDLGSRLDETSGAFLDTAAVMMILDLVICSDSAIAHLAGALGVPVWVALPYVPDWRWLLKREDSPWYPTMRLFRQGEPGKWQEVFERIAREVKKLLGPAN
jgi:tetratricopeptide (TPR) repeat protein